MALSAHEQMKEFWVKNQELKRPSSPWLVYKPHIYMMTSLTHRTTGIIMGTVLYGIAIGLFVAPGHFPEYIEAVKELQLSPWILGPLKSACAFPLIYHYINGIRHLVWDAGYGFELSTQFKTGSTIIVTAVALSILAGTASYLS